MSHSSAHDESRLGLASWNVGGPQTGWCEFVNHDTYTLELAMDEMMKDRLSPPNTMSALQCFRSAKRRLFAALRSHFPYQFDEKGLCAVNQLWSNAHDKKTIREAFELPDASDPFRRYSWGDRHFAERPHVLSSSVMLDPAVFTVTFLHGPVKAKIPSFRRFEEAWIEYMFQVNSDGELLRPMPVNKYMKADPATILCEDEIRMVSYLNLFYFDWSLVFFVWSLGQTPNPLPFWAIREASIQRTTLDARRTRTLHLIGTLAEQCQVVALQEVDLALEACWRVGPMSKVIMPSEQSIQMACLLVRDARSLDGWDIFNGIWPSEHVLCSRVAGAVLRMNGQLWMVVSAHCKPDDIDEIMAAMHSVRTTKFPTVQVMALMGDLNVTRGDLMRLSKLCKKHGFRSTWDTLLPVPDTVNNVRTKFFQAQLGKGGHVNRAPKDYILIKSFERSTLCFETDVVVGDECKVCEPDTELLLDLPSDHAAIRALTTF